MSDASSVESLFFLTQEKPCPYLPDRLERKIYTHLKGDTAPRLHNILSRYGFRRSQSIAYKPTCAGCQACVSVRVPVQDFVWSKRFQRIFKKGAVLSRHRFPAYAHSEHYSLFRAYVDARHPEGGMAHMTVLDYALMVEDSPLETMMTEYRLTNPMLGFEKGTLLGVMISDKTDDGLSLVYSFFEPEFSFSLGTLMILDHIHHAQELGLPFVYLGYWVKGSEKMDYKRAFLPQQGFIDNAWVNLS